MNPAFFNAVRASLFGGSLSQPQVEGCEVIIKAWQKFGDDDVRKLAYLLATAKHETADTMQPIHERGASAYFNKYEPGTSIGRNLGNTQEGDGYRFRGRGYVQLTGRANYVKAGTKLGFLLAANPEEALDPDTAARILITGCMEGWFTGKKLGDFINPVRADYRNARRVVNGTDKADLIAGYAEKFQAALKAMAAEPAGTVGEVIAPIPAPSRPSAPTELPDAPIEVPPRDERQGNWNFAWILFFAAVAACLAILIYLNWPGATS